MFRRIDWKELLDAQRNLDLRTFEIRGESYESTKEKRFLALLVELHELANETRCFKFWVNSPSGKRDKILMEYVDVLHFILSLFNSREESMDEVVWRGDLDKEENDFVSGALLELVLEFSAIVDHMFRLEKSHESGVDKPNAEIHDQLVVWTQKYLNLGGYLGFDWSEIVEAYWTKWRINVERQNSGKY